MLGLWCCKIAVVGRINKLSRNAFDILEKSEGSVPEATVLNVMHAVACALEYMHAKGYSHRDIKLENVLINTKNDFKLCDFGSSTK